MAATRGVLDPELELTSNRVELVGYLGRSSEVRYTIEREPVAVLSLATHRWKLDEREPRQLTDWHRVIAGGPLVADVQSLRVGELVRVVGRLQTSQWTDPRGRPRHTVEIMLEELRRERAAGRQARLMLSAPGQSKTWEHA